MGSSWESVLFLEAGPDRDEVFNIARAVFSECVRSTRATLHLMKAGTSSALSTLTSAEMASIGNKRLTLKTGSASYLETAIFSDQTFHFESPEVLLALQLSKQSGMETCYLYYNDSYSAAASLQFAAGELVAYDVMGWQGSPTRFRGGARNNPVETDSDIQRIVVGGVNRLVGQEVASSVDDLFEWFYGADSQVLSFSLDS